MREPILRAHVPCVRHDGFTILELMIVVALIGVVMAFAIPSLLGATKSGKEARAIGHLKMIATVNEQYSLRFGRYPQTVDQLVDTGILKHSRTAGDSGPDGYSYSFATSANTFVVRAAPDEVGVTGDRWFYVDQTGVIRWSSAGIANSTSLPID